MRQGRALKPGQPGYKRQRIKGFLRQTFQPGKVAKEKAAAEQAAYERERAAARERQIKEFAEQEAAEKLAAGIAAAKQAEQDRIAAEEAAARAEKNRLERIAAMEKRAAEIAAAEAAAEAEKAAQKERMARIKAAANKAAEEERAAAQKAAAEKAAKEAAEKAAAEKAEAERLAAIEAAKTPEQRAAEAEAARLAAEEAERAKEEARLKAEEEARAAAEAAKAAAEAEAAPEMETILVSSLPYTPVTPATDASVGALVGEVMSEFAATPQLLSYDNLGADRAAGLASSIAELQAAWPQPEPANLKAQLIGYWRLSATSCPELAACGWCGAGGTAGKSVLASYQCFSEGDDEGSPTMQTVEVLADARKGKAVVGSLAGDFYVGKLADSGLVGVVEEYYKYEIDDDKQFGVELVPMRWTCVHQSDSLRICRREATDDSVSTRSLKPADSLRCDSCACSLHCGSLHARCGPLPAVRCLRSPL